MDEGDGGARLTSRGERAALVAGSLGLVALHLWLSRPVEHPSVVFDEMGYLGNARLLAGGARWDMPFAPTYRAGYSVLLAPAFRLLHDPASQWRAVHVINAVLLASVFPLLVAVLRRVGGVRGPRALGFAAAGAVVPAVLSSGPLAVAEDLVLPLVLVAVLGAAELDAAGAEPRPWWTGAPWFGLAIGGLYATHPRFTLAVPVSLALLGWWAWSHPRVRRRAALEATAAIAVAAAGWYLDRRVVDARWVGVESLEGSPSDWWHLATSWSGIGDLFLTTVGQAWYLVAGSLGLAAIGVVALVLGRRDRPPGAGSRFAVAVVLAMAATVFATSVVFFATNHFRADHYVYGRHNDTFTPIWVAVGLAALASGRFGRPAWKVIAAAWVGIGLLGVIVAIGRDPADVEPAFSPFAVPAITRFIGARAYTGFWVALEVCLPVVAVLVLVAWAVERWPIRGRWSLAAVLPLVVGGWFLVAGHDSVDRSARFQHALYRDWHVPEDLERLGIRDLSIDASSARAFPLLSYPWHLPDVDVHSYNAAVGQQPTTAFALARSDDPARRRAGDRIALLDHGTWYFFWGADRGLAVWVRPGPEQDRLAARGALLPAGFPTELPATARRARIALAPGQPRTVTVRSGETAPVDVVVTHTGKGAPWPDFDSYGLVGRVRVKADVQPVDPDGEPGARSGAELTRWMQPGDTRAMTVGLIARGQLLGPLPPGRYRVQLGVGQEGSDWFASGGHGARFTLVVTR